MNGKQCSTESKSSSHHVRVEKIKPAAKVEEIQEILSLAKLCIRTIANQPNVLEEDVGSQLREEDAEYLYKVLPQTFPLELSAQYVPDGVFWKISSHLRWNSLNDRGFHEGSWRQLYFERHLAEMIETNEHTGDNEQLINAASIAFPFVHKLVIRQFKVLMQNTSEDYDYVVINLNQVFSILTELKEIDMTFGVIGVGMDFEKRFFRFSKSDCTNIGEGLASCDKLLTLSIRRSNLNTKKLSCMLDPLMSVGSLRRVSLAHCSLGNRSMSVIRELWKTVPLTYLDLTNNMINVIGMELLLEPVEEEIFLETLALSLNPLGEEGGVHLFENLRDLKHLQSLHVDGTQISNVSACSITTILERTKIKHIYLNNNTFEPICGEMFLDCVRENKTINTLDLRMTGIGSNCIKKIDYIISKNIEKKLHPNQN